MSSILRRLVAVTVLLVAPLFAQETTGGLQGTVKESSGAVVSHAEVQITGTSLIGSKQLTTDDSGYYRFANLPPGTYKITVTAKGFATAERAGLEIQVGHLPSIDFVLQVGTSETVVDVTTEAPLIDTTTETTQTNITSDVIQDVPHGRSFQSVIQFAPSASNEPLMGSNRASNGTGGVSPGNGSNGNAYGFSVAGGSDSENSYLVEGQSTANIIGGYSHTNVPFDFIQEVQVKSSGITAEHGGALGGVVNVVMKKGANNYHGSVFIQFENQALDGGPTQYQRYDPLGNINGFVDAATQIVNPVKPKTSDVFPGFTFGGPIKKDRAWIFVGFNPEFNDYERFVYEGPGTKVPFSQNTQTYYTTARLDFAVTQKLRTYASWLYQYQRQSGQNLPWADSTQGYYNLSTGCYGALSSSDPTSPYYCTPFSGVPASAYAHNLGYSAPNQTTNVGADWTITNHLVSTTRFGYYFENYHDFGFPTGGNLFIWQTNGIGAVDNTTGAPLPASLQQANQYNNVAFNANDTSYNANKAIQVDQGFNWYKSGWGGTHNFAFGYQLNRLSNTLYQHYNDPYTQLFVGNTAGADYSPATPTGQANCAANSVTPFVINPDGTTTGNCTGQYGYATVYDFGSKGAATSYNHGFFAQDAFTMARGITINAGVRVEREYLPGEGGAGSAARPINFGWGSKIAPRVGAAWDVFKNGKMKVFGSYGKYFDIMKLNVAISSFGGQYWQNCTYLLNTANLSAINPVFGSDGRYCEGPSAASQANFGGGSTPPGLTFIENQNLRAFPTTCSTCSSTQEGVAPGLNPYQQHETVFGVDYQLSKGLALEVRWDRRRLDDAIEDSSIFNAATGSETFVIVNPGKGINSTFTGFCNFIYGAGAGSACTSSNGQFPPNATIPAARSYDGVEFRLTKATSHNLYGMFSYTWSRFRGNYTGLTSSDISDGGFGGRNSPNNSRAFDEPYFSWNADGGSSSGLLPTDRPNKFKGYAYYELKWLSKFSTDFGLFQYLYQGSPTSTFLDAGYSYGGAAGGWPVYAVDRGNWVDITQNPTTGAITVGTPRVYRTPWYIQSDLNIQQNYRVGESKIVSFSATFTNLLNQHSVTAYNAQIDTGAAQQYVKPGGQFIADGVAFYAAAMSPYNLQAGLNNSNTHAPLVVGSAYGQPLYYQLSRNIRLGLKFTF